LIGVFSTAGQWIVVLAFRYADASVLAPSSYTQLLWVSILGFMVFGELPDVWTVVGAAFIVGSGLYTAHRERVRRLQLALGGPVADPLTGASPSRHRPRKIVAKSLSQRAFRAASGRPDKTLSSHFAKVRPLGTPAVRAGPAELLGLGVQTELRSRERSELRRR